MKITLSKEYEYGGFKGTELELNLEGLTGTDMIAIEKEMNDAAEFALTAETSPNVCARMAARAAGVGYDVIAHLPIKDFNAVKNAVRNFLTAAE